MADAEQQELLLSFIEEGNELLDESEPLLMELEAKSNESGEVDYEVLNTIFRLFHSLKGGAGFLDLTTVGKVTHQAETLLDLFRKGKGTLQSEHIDILTRTCDFLRQLLENIGEQFTDEGYSDEANDIIAALSSHIEKIKGGDKLVESTTDDTSEELTVPPPKQEEVPVTQKENDFPDDLQLTLTPEIIEQFVNEAEDLLSTTEQAFLSLDKEPANTDQVGEAFRSLHSFKGNAGFLGYSDLESLSHQAETVLDKIRFGEIDGNSELFSLLLEVLDFLSDGVKQAAEGKVPVIPAAPGLIHLMQDAASKLEVGSGDQETVSEEAAEAGSPPPPVIEIVKEPETKEKAAKSKAATKQPVVKSKKQPVANKTSNKNASQRQSIRVDIEKLGVLLDLVGELVIAGAMVTQNPDLKKLNVPLEGFEKSASHLNKLTRDLQEVATSIRMIPLSGTFKRMIRLVRDLAQKTSKKVDLEIIGEETEVDKTLIELMTDPLVHIIRNSIDHGIGTPDKRKEMGKPETGRLTLAAKYVGGEVWISVIDDGAGLRRDLILGKAIEKGLVEGDGSSLSDDDVWQLIFQPGFSTAEKVTDVSGRGVGMDVVRRNIENIHGKVNVRSESGQGTEVILRIPLTLAIIDGMIIRVGKSRYIIPIEAIRETMRVKYADITKTMDGQEIVGIRGHLLPVIRLHEFYDVEPTHLELPDGIIMVVENAGKQFCLFVDELVGQQQVVIKGLSQYLGKIKAISGCTILGDGEVCLIIDIGGIMSARENGDVAVAVQSTESGMKA